MSRAGIIHNSAANVLVGAVYTGGGIREYFDGVIDEVRIYNRALSDQEVLDVYNNF